ncbi:MAG: hypothetical protein O7A09_04865 [Proteobacteria bacterium]|nr:hypothetical protein [Pseudomonadota bacterium]
MRTITVTLAVGLALACTPEVPSLRECVAADGLVPICDFQNPEDLVLLPGGSWLLASQFASGEGRTGSLVGMRVSDERRRRLYPPVDGPDLGNDAAVAGWGDPDCPGPPDPSQFSPHGIDLQTQSRGVALAVVNHADREAIELFEVGWAEGGPALGWRGCVPVPEAVWPNDVAFLPDGGVVITNMMPPPEGLGGIWGGVRLLVGATTGSIMRWQPDAGWSEIAGSEGSGPNGIAVSPDGAEIFFGEWAGARLVRLRLDGEPSRIEIDLPHLPNNITWSDDGRLLVAGQTARIGEVLGCSNLEEGTCAIPFSVVAAEPATLTIEVVLSHPATAMGAASVAIQVGSDLYIGTFAGDRLARAPFPE